MFCVSDCAYDAPSLTNEPRGLGERWTKTRSAVKSALRLLSLGILGLSAFLCTVSIASAKETVIRLTADRIGFYYDRFLVEADGNVRVTTSDGLVMRGQTFSMDLKLNRFLVAGGVHVDAPGGGSQDGAALADFVDFDRVYFVPVTSEPDRWTFLGTDFTHPQKGREMPGDTFFFPDLGDAQPFLTAREATIEAKQFARFGAGRMLLAGAYVPEPEFYVNFSRSQHLAENSLAGASFDATYQFAGNANAISAMHFRYDPVNKAYASFEQHLASDKAYAVFSVNPLTRPSKFYNLVLGDQASPTFALRSFTQYHTLQNGFASPTASSHFTFVQLVQAFAKHSLEVDARIDNFSLAGEGNPYFNPHHDTYLTVSDNSYDKCVALNRFCYRYRGGFGFVHDPAGLQTIGATTYTHTSNEFLGLTAYVPSLPLIPLENPDKRVYFNGYFDKQRTWYANPSHAIDSANTSVSLSRILDPGARHLNAYVQYNVQNLGDFYSGSDAGIVYPGAPVISNGIFNPGFAAFHGQATFRTLGTGLIYTNSGDFSLSLLYRDHHDFPNAVPFFFSPPVDTYFQPALNTNYFGQPPHDLTADMRFRLNDHLSIDLQRTYFFNYQNMRWSPQFRVQVGP